MAGELTTLVGAQQTLSPTLIGASRRRPPETFNRQLDGSLHDNYQTSGINTFVRILLLREFIGKLLLYELVFCARAPDRKGARVTRRKMKAPPAT